MNKLTQLICLMCAGWLTLACIWDKDTLEMETQRFPNALELITGKFLRHSPEFYQWRIKDREAKLKADATKWSYYDDLAVAYSKLHNNAKAIELMLKKEKLHPGKYETYANLGTFYIHDKQYEKGLTYIKKAIAINPSAHFGREVYQQYLVEYVLSKMKNGKINLPLGEPNNNFYSFVANRSQQKDFTPQTAIKGILGMMKFGNHRSPILLEALGDLLRTQKNDAETNALHLAYLAYKKASLESKDKQAKATYGKRASMALSGQEESQDLGKLLTQSIKEGNAFYQRIRNDEMRWITEGKNPEEEFAKMHYDPNASQGVPYFVWILATLLGIALVWLIIKRKR